MGIQINGNTNNINAGIGSLSIEDLNELDIVGVATASNFKTGVSNLHNVGLTLSGGQIDVGSSIKLGNAGVITATSFLPVADNSHDLGTTSVRFRSLYAHTLYGNGSNLTGISAGTALSGSTNNTVCTVTGANAIQGESGLTYNGTRLDVTTGDLQVIGGEGGNAEIRIVADQGDDGADYWRFQSAASDNKLKLASYASGSWVDKVNVDTSGNLEVVGGNLVIGTSGNGVDFSAAGNAGGMTSELLDDYEEGTYSITITGSSSGSATLSNNYGVYTKIGRMVTVNMNVSLTNKNGISGDIQISLPFTVGDTLSSTSLEANGVIVYYTNLASNSSFLGLSPVSGGTNCQIRGVKAQYATSAATFTDGDFNNNTEFRGTVTYFV